MTEITDSGQRDHQQKLLSLRFDMIQTSIDECLAELRGLNGRPPERHLHVAGQEPAPEPEELAEVITFPVP
jgi:hypothetical protein